MASPTLYPRRPLSLLLLPLLLLLFVIHATSAAGAAAAAAAATSPGPTQAGATTPRGFLGALAAGAARIWSFGRGGASSASSGSAGAAGRGRLRFPSADNAARRINGSQLYELTEALARASVDPRTPAPQFWADPDDEEEVKGRPSSPPPPPQPPRRRRANKPRGRGRLPRAVVVLFLDSWRDDHANSLALRRLYESCLPAFFAREAVGFAVASYAELTSSAPARGLLLAPPRPAPRAAAAAAAGGRKTDERGQTGEGEADEAAWRRDARQRQGAAVAAAVAARPLAAVLRALPAIHVYGPGVGKGPGWRDRQRGRRRRPHQGQQQPPQRPQQPPQRLYFPNPLASPSSFATSSKSSKRKTSSSSSSSRNGGADGGANAPPPSPTLRRARYSGRHHLAALVRWVSDATGEKPLLSPDDAARLFCGFEGGAAEAMRGGGRGCPLADEREEASGDGGGGGGRAAKAGASASASSSSSAASSAAASKKNKSKGLVEPAWRCDHWDGEATAAEMRAAARASPFMAASAGFLAARAGWWWWARRRGGREAGAEADERRSRRRGRERERERQEPGGGGAARAAAAGEGHAHAE